MSIETIRMVYFPYVHSFMNYRIIFGGNQPYRGEVFQNSKKGDQNCHKFKNERLMYGTVSKTRNITTIQVVIKGCNFFGGQKLANTCSFVGGAHHRSISKKSLEQNTAGQTL
jgi:hypothetical protein